MQGCKMLVCSSLALIAVVTNIQVQAASLKSGIRITRSLSQSEQQASPTLDSCLDTLMKIKDDSPGKELSEISLDETFVELPATTKEQLTKIIEVQKNDTTASLLNSIVSGVKIAEFMIKFGADPNFKDIQGNSALHHAVMRGNFEVMKFLIEKQRLNPSDKNRLKNNALHLAADSKHENINIIKYLVEIANVDVNAPDIIKKTPVSLATYRRNYETVVYLIDTGKITEDVNQYVDRILLRSALENNTELVQWVINKHPENLNHVANDNSTALHYAVVAGNLETIKMLLETEIFDVNAKDSIERTALHWACFLGDIYIVKYLIEERNADFKLKDTFNMSVLHMAVNANQIVIVKYLIEDCKLDVNEKFNGGVTPLGRSAANGGLELLKYLVYNASADITVTDDNGRNALLLAAKDNRLVVVKFLIEELHFSVNSKDDSGSSALHLAAHDGRVNVVKYLVQVAKIDVNAVNNKGKTALQEATDNNKTEVVNWLQSQ